MYMRRELTLQEIDSLFQLIQKKGVKPLDVQIELVDHLASDIEDILSQNEAISFRTALEQSSTKFGRWGFDYFLQRAEASVYKRQSRLIWQAFSSFFRWPKALFTVILTLILWWGISKGGLLAHIRWVVVGVLVLGLLYIFFSFWRRRQLKYQLLLTRPPQALIFCGQIPSFLNLLLGEYWQNNLTKEAFATWATVFLVFSFIFIWASVEVYEHLRAESKRLYPQAFV